MTEPSHHPALSLECVSKAFQGQWALQDVDLEVRPSEIHALLGQNGSGKSTLIKILAGYHRPEDGASARRSGQPFDLGVSSVAHEVGLRFIHQDLGVINGLDATDNLALGQTYSASLWLSNRREARNAHEVFQKYGVDVDVSAPLSELTAAQRTMVAIVRALHHGPADSLIVLDEPTASLSVEESRLLFGLIRAAQQHGATILWVTHRLWEVFELADRVSVLRDGRRVDTVPTETLSEKSLVQMIIGRSIEVMYPEVAEPAADTALEVEGLSGAEVSGVTLKLRVGEIVGVTGLTGSGKDELLHLIYGSRTRTAGKVKVGTQELPHSHSPSLAIKAGMAFSSDRKAVSGILSWTLRENITLPRLSPARLSRWISQRQERADTRAWLERLDVVPLASEATFSSLSGGNQQKVIIARWLRCGAQVFLLEEPTGGVDIGAKQALYRALASAAAAGAAVLFVSTDIEEVVSISDRVLVMRDGVIGATLHGDGCTVATVTSEMIRVDQVPTRV